ncbi:MAG: twin-arginine translocase TatA/TatE family subunit [Gammaproteobacteria bacterium]|jgi:sec-independent protein translocase protein TatA|nr:twin-arginine translocase TatA/TatE family subunit [Gammaproteobacteria bacterium]|tara:strand:+ start:178 stop:411 length:234 start_codon:yes stop_codon:yes gene_type:complete
MPGMTELIVVLVIVVLLFGTKKLKTLGGDLGSAIKGFRSALGGGDDKSKLDADQEPQLKDVTPNTSTQDKVEANKEN